MALGPILTEVRRIREQHAERFHGDIRATNDPLRILNQVRILHMAFPARFTELPPHRVNGQRPHAAASWISCCPNFKG